ncbi:MAG: hypothetical protein HY234_00460 [Acidobacteria bacterium]|nr:hypothetical protein [Acidobacteriota bacterium]
MPSLKTLRTLLAIAAIALAFGGAGCRKRAGRAAPPLVIVPSTSEPQPSTQPAPTEPAAKPAETKPAIPAPAPLPELVVPSVKKSSPRSTTPRTAPVPVETPPAETTPPKPAPPRMSPRLTPNEQAEYERKTNAAIAAAEKNLQTAYGKQLNAAQSDLVEKIRGFLAQAREATRAGDWLRALNLAQKAQVLSVELVSSL